MLLSDSFAFRIKYPLLTLVLTVLLFCLSFRVWAFQVPEPVALPYWQEAVEPVDGNQSQTAELVREWKSLLSDMSDALSRHDYAALNPYQPRLDSYLFSLADIDPRGFGPIDQKAFWLNTYLAASLNLLLTHLPVESVLEIQPGMWGWLTQQQKRYDLTHPLLEGLKPGMWKMPVVTVSGQQLTLFQIEHGILRPLFQDPRIHFVIHPFNRTGNAFPERAFHAGNVEPQLQLAAVRFINRNGAVRYDAEKQEFQLNRLFDWYLQDFGGSEANLMRILMRYSNREQRALLAKAKGSFDYYYDWRLNTGNP